MLSYLNNSLPRALSLVALIVMATQLTGCAAFRRPMNMFATPGPVAPVVLQPTPTLNEVIGAVNSNTMRVTSYVTYNAKISAPGMLGIPILNANIAAEQPNKFRMRASTAISGPEIDLGSNPEEFWFWVKQSEPKALYHCRHDQFANSPARDMLPIEPQWVSDALGLVYLDPNLPHEGPTPHGNGRLEITTTLFHPTGSRRRVTVVDATRAWVLEQHLYDSAGQLIASSQASDFRYDPEAQVSLPNNVAIRVPSQNVSFSIDLGTILVNRYPGDAAMLWTRPVIENTPSYDLGTMAMPQVSQVSPVQPVPKMPFVSQPLPAGPHPAHTLPPNGATSEIASMPMDTSSQLTTPAPSTIPAGGIALPRY